MIAASRLQKGRKQNISELTTAIEFHLFFFPLLSSVLLPLFLSPSSSHTLKWWLQTGSSSEKWKYESGCHHGISLSKGREGQGRLRGQDWGEGWGQSGEKTNGSARERQGFVTQMGGQDRAGGPEVITERTETIDH